jgi:hypothetical protein
VADGSARLLRRLTRDGHDLDDLFGAEGGRRPRSGSVVENLFQEDPQLLSVLVQLGTLQVGRRLKPAVTPVANGQAGQAQLLSDGLDARIGRQGEDDRGAADQALVGGLLSQEALQQGLLCRGHLESRRSWSSHSSTPSANDGTIRSESHSMEPTPIPVSHLCRHVLVFRTLCHCGKRLE